VAGERTEPITSRTPNIRRLAIDSIRSPADAGRKGRRRDQREPL